MLRSSYVRQYLAGSLSTLIGIGISLLIVWPLNLNEDIKSILFFLIAFLISIPFFKLILFIIKKQIGPPEV